MEGFIPLVANIIFKDPKTGHTYNAIGEPCDRLGRLFKPRGHKGRYSSNGKCDPNCNPGGRCANPPHVHHRFGEFARDSAPASSSGSQGPPPQPSQPAAASSQPAAAPSQPAAAHRPHHCGSQSSRAHSTGPPLAQNTGRANRRDWHPVVGAAAGAVAGAAAVMTGAAAAAVMTGAGATGEVSARSGPKAALHFSHMRR